MKKSYRFIAVLSSLIICVAAFSACGADNNSNDSSISNSSAQSSSDESSEKKTSSDDESKMMNQAKILKKMRTQKKVLKQPKIQIQKIRLIRKALRLKAVSTVNKMLVMQVKLKSLLKAQNLLVTRISMRYLRIISLIFYYQTI